jgi:hypothetical protein
MLPRTAQMSSFGTAASQYNTQNLKIQVWYLLIPMAILCPANVVQPRLQ